MEIGGDYHMVNGKSIIALCTTRIYDPQIHGFIQTLNEKLKPRNCALLVFTINADIYWEENSYHAETYVYDIIPYDELDCLILMDEKLKSHTLANRIIHRSRENNVPVIVIDGAYEGTISLNFDYQKGFEQIVRHMIEFHQARRPHMMAGIPGNPFSDERIEIFKKVLAENGLAYDESMLSYGDFWADPTRAATQKLLERKTLPDAIICANDIMAMNVSAVLQEAGVRVPEDVKVSGFDGYEQIFFSTPKISSVSCDSDLMAEAAGDTVLRLISGKPVEEEAILPKLIPNESCGCPSMIWQAQQLLSSFNNSFYRHQEDVRILYDITTSMETSRSPWEMASRIHHHKTKNLVIVVDRNCFSTDRNYFLTEEKDLLPKDLHMINDADYAEEMRSFHVPMPASSFYDPRVNNKESVLSGNYRKRIIELLDIGYPLIFNALDYMNRPFGFACYHFHDYAITDYSRSASITNAISMGIGTFVNMQYQRFLLNQMDDMYKHDALTGLYNRFGFHDAFERETSLEENHGKTVTLIMSDLDGLKMINDTFGHADGDMAIAAVARALKESCPPNALSVRFGGDELFSLIIGDCDAESIIQDINRRLSEFNATSHLPFRVSTSCGACTSILDANFEFKKALKLADEKMYIIKNARHK